MFLLGYTLYTVVPDQLSINTALYKPNVSYISKSLEFTLSDNINFIKLFANLSYDLSNAGLAFHYTKNNFFIAESFGLSLTPLAILTQSIFKDTIIDKWINEKFRLFFISTPHIPNSIYNAMQLYTSFTFGFKNQYLEIHIISAINICFAALQISKKKLLENLIYDFLNLHSFSFYGNKKYKFGLANKHFIGVDIVIYQKFINLILESI